MQSKWLECVHGSKWLKFVHRHLVGPLDSGLWCPASFASLGIRPLALTLLVFSQSESPAILMFHVFFVLSFVSPVLLGYGERFSSRFGILWTRRWTACATLASSVSLLLPGWFSLHHPHPACPLSELRIKVRFSRYRTVRMMVVLALPPQHQTPILSCIRAIFDTVSFVDAPQQRYRGSMICSVIGDLVFCFELFSFQYQPVLTTLPREVQAAFSTWRWQGWRWSCGQWSLYVTLALLVLSFLLPPPPFDVPLPPQPETQRNGMSALSIACLNSSTTVKCTAWAIGYSASGEFWTREREREWVRKEHVFVTWI